jgi:hypothetical protein
MLIALHSLSEPSRSLTKKENKMFITLVDEKAGTELPGILVEMTHDDTRGTVFVLDPVSKTFAFVPRIPYGPSNAYVDDDGKHGQYFQEGDPTGFPDGTEIPPPVEPEPEPEDF